MFDQQISVAIVTLNTEIQSKPNCRISSKLQEIMKPANPGREVSRLRKLEKETEKKNSPAD